MTVGTQYDVAENGWVRFEETNSNFEYSTGWTNWSGANTSGGTDKRTNTIGQTIRFGFTGTSIRIISPINHDLSNVLKISIDGKEEVFSENSSGLMWRVCVYEKTGLQNKKHSVVITTLSTAISILDAVDLIGGNSIISYQDSLPTKKMILQNANNPDKAYSMLDNTLIHLPDSSTRSIIAYGIDSNKNVQLDTPFIKHKHVIYDSTSDTYSEEVVDVPEGFSVYNYIGETPKVLVYTESTNDINVSTTTEPFDIYDEFGDSVEALYYTDNMAVANADLVLEANWSPVDELEGDFEVVTWTDENSDTAQRTLEMLAVPKPQFIYKASPYDLSNGIEKIIARDLSQYVGKSPIRLLLTSDNVTWFTWMLGNFIQIPLDNNNIVSQGLTIEEATSLSKEDLSAWTLKNFNIGVFLADDSRDKNISKVAGVSFNTQTPSGTSRISDANFYILNTTATINVDLSGLTLTGQVDDADMTRVQYRVILNDEPYYPADGAFTPLSSPPLNIDLTIQSSDVKIGDWNTIKVEFQDYFGTMDYWEARFIGKYAGLMFMDTDGKYYSSDVGQVLQYLDFGQILTGQITPSYEVKLKNDYGFDVKNVELAINTSKFAQGLEVQLAGVDRQFDNETRLKLGDLANEAETSFFIRMVSSVTAIPNDNKDFNIVVTAQRVI